MRLLIGLVIGFVLGGFVGVTAFKALRASTELPRGVMQTTAYHFGELREAAKASDCLGQAEPHLQALALLADDVHPSFAELLPDDEIFNGYAAKLVTATRNARDNPGVDCKALNEAIAPIRDACQACHRDYKS
ncbi:cytochrome c [Pseudomarimonas arenosa]|uniref:Cytochrome c n=1 Tax=Pseudomarimonas arenosa TaxID=2774145 RepID=A0AAW3ZLD0_9GAMM|nr:cytochrome c [Pseudomarimonas arenosa]MBD8526920.1 cytochrome c [Pseudomarimonas arenosa]